MEEGNLEFRVDHTALTVSNLDRSIRWYGMFGFQEQNRFERADLKVKGALLKLSEYRLELFEPYEPQKLEVFRQNLAQSLAHIGPQHVALLVDDLDKAYKYLQGKGVKFAADITTGKTAKYAFCKDPDGILLEIKQELG